MSSRIMIWGRGILTVWTLMGLLISSLSAQEPSSVFQQALTGPNETWDCDPIPISIADNEALFDDLLQTGCNNPCPSACKGAGKRCRCKAKCPRKCGGCGHQCGFESAVCDLLANRYVNLCNYSNVSFLDMAIPQTMFQVRFDSAWNMNYPDRGEYFWPKSGNVGGSGPPLGETQVNWQDVQLHNEFALSRNSSVFIENTVRFLDPTVNDNTAGPNDFHVGAKYAFYADPDIYFTAQVRGYVPTGDDDRGLGTGHASVEPSALGYVKLENLILEGQLGSWLPINGASDFQGYMVFYGAGAGYIVYQSADYWVVPVAELIGYTFLNGRKSAADGDVFTAGGDTILNGALGVRIHFAPNNYLPITTRPQLYAGYNRAILDQRFHEDLARVEFRVLY